MIFTGTNPAARNRSWNSVSENFEQRAFDSAHQHFAVILLSRG
jgi:hypothetical protein